MLEYILLSHIVLHYVVLYFDVLYYVSLYQTDSVLHTTLQKHHIYIYIYNTVHYVPAIIH